MANVTKQPERPCKGRASFQQREDGVLISVNDKPLIVLKNAELIYDHRTGLTIRKDSDGGEVLAAMLFGEVGNWSYKITGIELIEERPLDF